MPCRVAIAHDYLTQRGGAERVVLAMAEALGNPPLYTSLYDADSTFERFRDHQIHTTYLNRLHIFRKNHRLAMPFLFSAFESLAVDADVLLCSSSGWAHAIRTNAKKIVYCYTPARWLYQTDTYVGWRNPVARAALQVLRPLLVTHDKAAAKSAARYLAISTAVRDRVRSLYGIAADVLPAPYGVDPAVAPAAIPALEPGFLLCMARLLPYKNVDKVIAAVNGSAERLVVVGRGPESRRLRQLSTEKVRIIDHVSEAELCWLLQNCAAVVSASYEDYGLLPIEAAVFGRPSVVLRWGGFVDTVLEDVTGIFFEQPDPRLIREAIKRVRVSQFDPHEIKRHADMFSPSRFAAAIRNVVLAAKYEENDIPG